MASIHKRDGKYRLRWYDLTGHQRSLTVSDHATAKRIVRAIEHAKDNGSDWSPPRAGGVPGLEVMLADVIRGKALSASAGYVRILTLAAGQLLAMLEGRYGRPARAGDLSHQALVDLHVWLTQVHATEINQRTGQQRQVQCNPRTATARVNIVRSLWVELHAHEVYSRYVGSAPCRVRGLPNPEAPLQPAPTWEEMDATITVHVNRLPSWYQEQLLPLARFTGLRRSQLMALRWDWVDIDHSVLWVHPSVGKSRQERRGRRIPLSPHLVDRMAGWGRRKGFLVDTGTRGRTVCPPSLYRCWEASGARREVWAPTEDTRGQPLHAYRHGMATGLLLAGAAEHLVARYLGQAARTVTGARYADMDTLMQPALREIAEMIPDIGEQTPIVHQVDFTA